jgi:lysine 2,3-aminomutase
MEERMINQPGTENATSPFVPPRSPLKSVPIEEAAERLRADSADWRIASRLFPVRWPEGYLALAEGVGGEPIRRMGLPDPAEAVPDPGDLADPVGESGREIFPFVVRKHADRVILLVTARCHFYCRFCFRRSFPDGAHADPSRDQLAAAIGWIRSEPAVTEVILSGGDPLVLADERLASLVDELSDIPHVERLRIHSRAPVHEPSRVSRALVAILGRGRPLRLVTHFNHAVEITPASRAAVDLLLDGSIPVLNQSVLLAGVNAEPEVLADLIRGLVAARVEPYYLHHPDRVPGAARFRVSIPEGLAIAGALADLVPADVLPAYVIDVPDGSGKVAVSSLEALGSRRFRAPNGFEWDDIG